MDFNSKFIKKIHGANRIVLLNIIGLIILKGLTMLLTLFLFPEYIRFFENNDVLGVWFTILSVLNWVLLFDLGLGNGLRNKLPKVLVEKNYDEAKKYISSTYISATFLAALFTLIVLLLARFINWNDILNISNDIVEFRILLNVVLIVLSGITFQFIFKLITSIMLALQKAFAVNLLGFISNLIIFIVLKFSYGGTIEDKLTTMAWLNVIAINLPLILYSFYLFMTELKYVRPSLKYFKFRYCKEVLNVGIKLLWLQLVAVVIICTNEFLIGWLTSPKYVVDYQAYYKIYHTGAIIFSLALMPIWSAVTKAQAKKNYTWIKKVYKVFLLACGACAAIELVLSLFVHQIFDIWLGQGAMQFNLFYGIVFVISSTLFILHNVNTSISNGLSYFKFQMVGMTIAAVIDIPLAYLFVQVTGGWIGVLIASSVAILFYETLAPYYTFRYINKMITDDNNTEICS